MCGLFRWEWNRPWTLALPLVKAHFPLSPQLCGSDFES